MNLNEALDYCERGGLYVPSEAAIPDGKIRRFKVGESHKANGWVFLVEHEDRIYGAAGDWRSGLRLRIGERDAAWHSIAAARKDESSEIAAKAAERARAMWAVLPERGRSAYLERKRVPAIGLRYGHGCVAVPMQRGGEIVGLQRIFDDGFKLFTKGCIASGVCYHVGSGYTDLRPIIMIAEGYASCASMYMAMNCAVPAIVAFNAGNLKPVAVALRTKYPSAKLIIAADNDCRTKGNPGLTYARKAAAEVGAKVIYPRDISGTDVNDLHCERGLDALRELVVGAL